MPSREKGKDKAKPVATKTGTAKPGAGRRPNQLKRAALPAMPQPARLQATLYGPAATGHDAVLREFLLYERNASATSDLLQSPDTPGAGFVHALRAFMAAWLANASADAIRALADWIEDNPPGQLSTLPVDPIAHGLVNLPRAMGCLKDREGRVRCLKYPREVPDDIRGKTVPYVDPEGRPVDYDVLSPSAHPVGFADPMDVLPRMRDPEILARLKEFFPGMEGVTRDALRKAMEAIGVPRPPRQRKANGTFA
jgi:hypothetical protein